MNDELSILKNFPKFEDGDIENFRNFLAIFKWTPPPPQEITKIDWIATSESNAFYEKYKSLFPNNWMIKDVFETFVLNNISISKYHKNCLLVKYYLETMN